MTDQTENKKSGFLAVVGRPNVGKSTMMNAIMGKKYVITSHHPQTTKTTVRLILQKDNKQLVLVDTPGLHHQTPFLINQKMNQMVHMQIQDCDAIAWVVDAMRFSKEDEAVLELLKVQQDKPIYLVINKIDLLPSPSHSLQVIDNFQKLFKFHDIVPISAQKKHNIDRLLDVLLGCAYQTGWLFDASSAFDCRESFILAEFIRESLIRQLKEEVVYAIGVEIREMKKVRDCMHIHADIWVDKASQKAIVLGRSGHLMKTVGILSRRLIEKFLGCHVFLKLWVTVKPGWRNKPHLIHQQTNQ